MESIEHEIAKFAFLQTAASAIIEYVRAVSRDSEFHRYTEWMLEPDNWIVLRFSFRRGESIQITLGIPLQSLPDTTGLRTGRKWTTQGRIYVDHVTQLPTAFRCIEYAFYHTRNR